MDTAVFLLPVLAIATPDPKWNLMAYFALDQPQGSFFGHMQDVAGARNEAELGTRR
jgi:hypothetical protein